MEWFVDVDRLEDLLEPSLGILVGLEPIIRIDLALEFLKSGLLISSVGESNGEVGRDIGFPSGIVLGGDIVILLVRLPVLFSSPPVSVGEATKLLLIVDADVRDATGMVGGWSFGIVAVSSRRWVSV